MAPAPGSGPWYVVLVLGPLSLTTENASCTAGAIVFGRFKDRSATVSTGVSMAIRMDGLCQVSPLQHSRLLRCQSCSFLCVDSCEAGLIV